MRNFFKIIIINSFLVLVFFCSIELTLGYWFDKDNLGAYMREYRMRKNTYSVIYEEKKYEFVYKRNYYGFRGNEFPLEKITAVLMGGSTTDERYKPDEFTITELINKKISNQIKNVRLFNAGIEGQTTRGHMANLKYWFPKLKDFNPKYLIYYIGINDQFFTLSKKDDSHDGVVLEPNPRQRLWDNIKTRSIFYDLTRKIKHKYYNSDKKLLYDFDISFKEYHNRKKKNFISYQEFIKNNSLKEVLNDKDISFKFYLERVDKLYEESVKMGSVPIFINQLDATGFDNKQLVSLNTFLIDHCEKKKYHCIDVAKKLNGKNNYWWDGIHTTPKGSEAIANIVAPELIKIFQNN